MDEFEHYFRICLHRTLSKEEARAFLFAVNRHADVEPDSDDTVMVYHVNTEGEHCYDVRLASDVKAEEGDNLVRDLEKVFDGIDFDAESSMELVEEQTYLLQAGLKQL